MDIDNYYYKSGTNGLVYHTMLFPCDSLSDKELQISSLYASSLTDVGLGSDSYEQIQKYQSSITGGLSASFMMIPNEDGSEHMLALKVSGKSLEKNAHLMHKLILKTVNEANLDDKKRIKELLSFISADNEQSLTQNGHILAMANAAAQITPEASTNDLTSGIRFINNTGILSKDAENSENLDIYIKNLKSIQSKISSAPKYIFTASSLEEEELNLKLSNAENAVTVSDQKFVSIQNDSVGWITGSQVCFCAEAFPSVESSHEDAPALSILGAVLRNGYLHSAIREKGGAYGSGAMQDSNNKVFKFFSYRDPKCSETFTEFNNARQWSLSNITEAQLDEGILGVISSIDKPMSPYGEAVSDFMSELDHKKQKDRLLFRNRVKECTVSDLVRVSKKYLFSESKKSVIAGENFQDEIQKMGFKLKNI
jgi:Zn-dependent M16 (insulinase) family peptidase